MYVSYSGYKLYRNCPQAYWHSYINNTVIPGDAENRVNSLYGSVVGVLFERFYNDRLWKKSGQAEKALMDLVDVELDTVIKDETTPTKFRPAGVVTWQGLKGDGLDPKANYTSREELVADIRDAIPRGIRSIKHDRLLGKYAEAEVKLNTTIQGGKHILGGRADMIIHRARPHRDKVIVDGKGSKWRERYVDPTQLKWYAALYAFHNDGDLPDKLAFLYWRFSPPESMDWVDFHEADIQELLDDVTKAIEEIERGSQGLSEVSVETMKEEGPPARVRRAFPSKGARAAEDGPCRFCTFIKLCPEGAQAIAASKKKKKKSSQTTRSGVES